MLPLATAALAVVAVDTAEAAGNKKSRSGGAVRLTGSAATVNGLLSGTSQRNGSANSVLGRYTPSIGVSGTRNERLFRAVGYDSGN